MTNSLFLMIKRLAMVLGLCFASTLEPASALASENTLKVVVLAPLQSVHELLDKGQIDQAEVILSAIAQLPPEKHKLLDPVDLQFAKGRLFMAKGQRKQAARLFDDILIHHPALVRVRLELAMALYLAERDDRAAHHFKLALAGGLPEASSQNVKGLLCSIRNRRPVRYRFELALAPNTNINTATDSDTVDIFGLPFTLNNDSRSKSGVGVFVSGGVDWEPRLNATTKLAVSLQGQRTEYKGKSFDDTIISTRVGPMFGQGRLQWHVAATGFRRWFGTSGFNAGVGGLAQVRWRANNKWDWALVTSLQRLNYDLDKTQNGELLATQIQATYGLDARTLLIVKAGANRHFARAGFQSNTAWHGRFDFYRELVEGVSLTLSPEIIRRGFDEAHPLFGARRRDTALGASIEISKRDIRMFGLTPVVRYSFLKNTSNIGVYAFKRHQMSLGFTKLF